MIYAYNDQDLLIFQQRRIVGGVYGFVCDKVCVAKLLAIVHGKAGCPTSESVALGTKFSSVAGFTEEGAIVLGTVCAVQQLVAHGTLEASFVPLVSACNLLLRGVHGLVALRALLNDGGLKRHTGCAERESCW